MNALHRFRANGYIWLAIALLATTVIYWPGLSGSWLFDDYPNIVDNRGVQPPDASLPSLITTALSSPSSDFKRPLSSLSFAANYLAAGLNPYWMKLTNLVIHLLNGWLVFLLTRLLLVQTQSSSQGNTRLMGIVAALIAAGWMLLPINLTAVLYVVQRMESLANLFVLLGLAGYVVGRRRMLPLATASLPKRNGFLLCLASLTLPTAVGILAKETAALLPLYALSIEWTLFRFQNTTGQRDRRIIVLFMLVLVLPMITGLAWLLPGVLSPDAWSTRDFTLGTRLLSEARIVIDYIGWTLLPLPRELSFYHDDVIVSTGLFRPWTTLTSLLALAALIALAFRLRRRLPLVSLGIGLFLACQLLTATIMPLELIYEHRNYFASFGLLLALVPLLSLSEQKPIWNESANGTSLQRAASQASDIAEREHASLYSQLTRKLRDGIPSQRFTMFRRGLLVALLLMWAVQTAMTAYAWGDPLRLAQELAERAPDSPRAQYELGRTYIIYSQYDPASPYTHLAYAPLERAATLPGSSILPQQALIFMNSRMHLPLKDEWWNSLIAKLHMQKPTVQDESSLAALTQCAREHQCDLPQNRMMEAFMAALASPDPDARLLATYSDYAWNELNDRSLGQRMIALAVLKSPYESAYRVTLIRMLLAEGKVNKAHEALGQLQSLNFGGRLDAQLAELRALPGMQ